MSSMSPPTPPRHRWVRSIRPGRQGPASVVRARTTILVLVATWAIGLIALVAVISVQSRVDNQRHAQVVVEIMQRQVEDLAGVAFNPALAVHGAGPTATETKRDLAVRKSLILKTDATLAGLGSGAEEARIGSLLGRYFPEVDRLAALVARGASLQAAIQFGRDQQPGHTYGALFTELRHASAGFGSGASHARTIAWIGTTVAIVFMLLAFSLTLHRATRLALEKQELLKRSRVEALTDLLTGLPNRRKLFADMNALLEEPPPEGLALGMFDLDGFKDFNDTFGHPAGDSLLARLGQGLAAAIEGHGTAYRMGGDEFCVIARGPDFERILVSAQEALSERSGTFNVTCSHGSLRLSPGEVTVEHALQLVDQRLYANKRSPRTREGGDAHKALLRLLSEKSAALSTHLSNVGMLASAVARKLGLSESEISLTRLTAELHDIGKTAIPDAILDKPGPLDDEEWGSILRHTIIGDHILAAAPGLASVASLVRSSHERFDGTGYPDGLSGEGIPLSSRIVAVADAFDAMVSARPYATRRTPEGAIEELRRYAGTQFDATVVEAFIAVRRDSARAEADLGSLAA